MSGIVSRNRNRFIENRLTAVRGEGVVGLGEEGEGIKQKKQTAQNKRTDKHRQQNSEYQRERGVGEVEGGEGAMSDNGRILDLGW